jgi:hypothetical protein
MYIVMLTDSLYRCGHARPRKFVSSHHVAPCTMWNHVAPRSGHVEPRITTQEPRSENAYKGHGAKLWREERGKKGGTKGEREEGREKEQGRETERQEGRRILEFSIVLNTVEFARFS